MRMGTLDGKSPEERKSVASGEHSAGGESWETHRNLGLQKEVETDRHQTRLWVADRERCRLRPSPQSCHRRRCSKQSQPGVTKGPAALPQIAGPPSGRNPWLDYE